MRHFRLSHAVSLTGQDSEVTGTGLEWDCGLDWETGLENRTGNILVGLRILKNKDACADVRRYVLQWCHKVLMWTEKNNEVSGHLMMWCKWRRFLQWPWAELELVCSLIILIQSGGRTVVRKEWVLTWIILLLVSRVGLGWSTVVFSRVGRIIVSVRVFDCSYASSTCCSLLVLCCDTLRQWGFMLGPS